MRRGRPSLPVESEERPRTRAPKVSFSSPEGVDPRAPNSLLLEAAARNEARLVQANLEDETTLGEINYCSSDPNCFLPEPAVGPDDTFDLPAWLLKEITIIAATPSPTPTKSSVRFDVSREAADHNASLLRAIDYDFQNFFQQQAGTTLAFSSEFRPIEQIRPLLRRHPGFPELAEVLVTGMPYRYSREITEKEREQEVLAMLVRGNHKSAKEEPEIVEKLLTKDVVHGPWFFNGYTDRAGSTNPKCHGSTSWTG
jgi:hypothetical protein